MTDWFGVDVPDGTCSIEGCARGGSLRRGWCNSHYMRWYAKGDPEAPRLNRSHAGREACAVPGCTRTAKNQAWCVMHYSRYYRTGDPEGFKTRKPKPPVSDTFWKHVNVGAVDECWEWQSYRNKQGYGTFAKHPGGPDTSLAHRAAWILTYGPIDSPRILVCHKCDNKACCNPNHFFLGSHKDNTRDMVNKGQHWLKRADTFTDTAAPTTRVAYRNKWENIRTVHAQGADGLPTCTARRKVDPDRLQSTDDDLTCIACMAQYAEHSTRSLVTQIENVYAKGAAVQGKFS